MAKQMKRSIAVLAMLVCFVVSAGETLYNGIVLPG